ncbi:Protein DETOXIFICATION 16 [Bienertia sinuspersici]
MSLYWLRFFLLAIYVNVWNKTWNGLSEQAFFNIWSFLKLTIPSPFMICLEYWSFEMMVYMICVGLGATVRGRTSKAAHLAFYVMGLLFVIEGLVVVIITILIHHVWQRLYSGEEDVVRYVAKMMLLLAISDFLDRFKCTCAGARKNN